MLNQRLLKLFNSSKRARLNSRIAADEPRRFQRVDESGFLLLRAKLYMWLFPTLPPLMALAKLRGGLLRRRYGVELVRRVTRGIDYGWLEYIPQGEDSPTREVKLVDEYPHAHNPKVISEAAQVFGNSIGQLSMFS